MDNLEFVTKAHKNKILVEFLAPKRVAKAANNNLGTILADVIIPGTNTYKSDLALLAIKPNLSVSHIKKFIYSHSRLFDSRIVSSDLSDEMVSYLANELPKEQYTHCYN